MAHSSDLPAGPIRALKSQYNNLRKDVLDPTTGHSHDGAADNGKKIATASLESVATLATPSTLVARDVNGNTAVAPATDNTHAIPLSTIVDTRQSNTVFASASQALPETSGNLDYMVLNFTTVRPSIVLVFFNTSITGSDYSSGHFRAVLDDSVLSEEYRSMTTNVVISFSAHYAFTAVAAGAHNVRIRGRDSSQLKSVTDRRMSIIVIPLS